MSLSALLHWFYCLDYPEIFLVVTFGSCFYLWVFPRILPSRVFRVINGICLALSIGLILLMTLSSRSPIDAVPSLIPFHSYREAVATGNVEIYRSNLMNILLFFPFGMFWVASNRRKITTGLLFAIALSFSIEICQYNYLLGNPEIDDIIHNTLGSVLGMAVSGISLRYFFNGRKFYGSDDEHK